jgi:hypothetical protein
MPHSDEVLSKFNCRVNTGNFPNLKKSVKLPWNVESRLLVILSCSLSCSLQGRIFLVVFVVFSSARFSLGISATPYFIKLVFSVARI